MATMVRRQWQLQYTLSLPKPKLTKPQQILFVQYWTDKFCLLRVWGWSPMLGSRLAIYSRRYFFTGAVVAFVISSSYAWAQFSYDNVCDPVNGTVTPTSITIENVRTLEQSPLTTITVGQEEPVFSCAQGSRRQQGVSFPPSADDQPNGLKWMNEDQETVVTLFYWSTLIGVIFFLVGAFSATVYKGLVALFKNTYEV